MQCHYCMAKVPGIWWQAVLDHTKSCSIKVYLKVVLYIGALYSIFNMTGFDGFLAQIGLEISENNLNYISQCSFSLWYHDNRFPCFRTCLLDDMAGYHEYDKLCRSESIYVLLLITTIFFRKCVFIRLITCYSVYH